MLISLALLASAALMESPTATASAAPAAAKEKLICKRQPRPGSLVGDQRVCGTKEFWEEQRREAKRAFQGDIDGCRNRSADPTDASGAASAPC